MMAQGVIWADVANVRDKDTAEERLRSLERTIRHYSYATVVATWHGDRDDRLGLYAVLDGRESAISATVERLASGLVFAVHVVGDLNRTGYVEVRA